MGLRIATNVASLTVQRNLRQANTVTEDSLQRMSSGKRITKSADDAAGLAVATSLEAQTRGLRQAIKNANQGMSFIQVAEGGIGEVSNMLARLRELGIQAASDTVGDEERGFLDEEYQQILQEIDRVANSTTFNGTNLINGTGQGEMKFQVGINANEENSITFDSSKANVTTDAIGVGGTSISERESALDILDRIDEAFVNVAGNRATLGSVQSRLQYANNNLETQALNQDAAKSTIEDADIALETSNLAARNIIKQAGIQSLSQANGIPNSALRLIG